MITGCLLLVACSGGADDASTATAPATDLVAADSTTPATTLVVEATDDPVVIDETFLADQVAKSWDPDLDGAVMVVVHDANGGVAHASSGTDPDGLAPDPDDVFRIGSITKTLTAIAVLTLVDDGLVDLDTPVDDYIVRVDAGAGVTVRHLLQHMSGIPDLTAAPGFVELLVDDLSRQWTPEESVELAQERDQLFEPGSTFSYSNTNFLVLGVLVEEVTGQPFHTVIRERITAPLGMEKTYVGWYESGLEPFGGYSQLLGPIAPIDFDFTSTDTNAWASGSIVSSAGDLHVLFSALFDGRILSATSLEAMTTGSELPLGLAADTWGGSSPLFGHDGRIWGSGTWVLHAPETGSTVFTVTNSDLIKVTPATRPVALAISGEHVLG